MGHIGLAGFWGLNPAPHELNTYGRSIGGATRGGTIDRSVFFSHVLALERSTNGRYIAPIFPAFSSHRLA